MVRRRPHDRQAERDIDGIVEGDGLDRDESLVVIHAERGVVAGPRLGVEQGIGGKRAAGIDARAAQLASQREINGRNGPEPVRYDDWEVKGIASDF